jgi:elongation factor 1 alpha-like protein
MEGQNAQDFFADVPWGIIPSSRQSIMVHVPRSPNLGLLGGSSKPSKLTALAASRKKQNEEKKRVETQASDADRAVNILDRLAKKDTVTTGSGKDSSEGARTRFTAAFRAKSNVPVQPEVEEKREMVPVAIAQDPPLPIFKARPSIFAKALCGVENDSSGGANLDSIGLGNDSQIMFNLPYTTSKNYIKEDPFAKPSPDDVVLAAQRQGSLHS